MRQSFTIFAVLAAALLLQAGCAHKAGTGASGGIESEKCPDDSFYCFNQHYVVRYGCKYGVMDSRRRMVIPARYRDICFVRDDIALLEDSVIFSLADTTGWVFYESTDSTFLMNSYRKLYDSAVDRNSLIWDRVLDEYEMLCNECIDARNGKSSYAEALSRLDKIKETLSEVQTSMSREQADRFLSIQKRFSR